MSTNYLETFQYDESTQTYICGYVAHSVQKSKNIKCNNCKQLVVKSIGEKVNNEYFDYLQRGGLCVAQAEVKYIYYHLCAIFEYIINAKEILTNFLFRQNHKYLLASLALASLESDSFFINFTGIICGTPFRHIFLKVALTFSKIVLQFYKK